MSTQTQNSDLVNVSVERLEGCQIKLTVEVDPSLSQKQFDNAVKKLAKNVSLPGYRKGKAPKEYILQKYEQQLDREWKEMLAQDIVPKSLEKSNCYPLDRNTRVAYDWVECHQDKPSKAILSFETKPDVPHIDLSKLKGLKAPKRESVKASQIDEHLEDIKPRFASFEPVERASKKGDFVDIDCIKLDTNSPLYQNSRFEINDDMPKWLKPLVLKKKKDDSSEGSYETPGKDSAVPCKVTIKGVYERKLPELNDEFAKKLGLENLEALRERLQQELEMGLEGDFREQASDLIQEELVKLYDFEVPKSLLESEIRLRKEQAPEPMLDEEKSKKLSEDKQKKELEKLKEEYEAQIQAEARDALKNTFLLYQLIDQEKFSVSEEQLRQRMGPYLMELQNEKDPQKLRERFQSLYQHVRMQALSEKVLNHIMAQLGWDKKEEGAKKAKSPAKEEKAAPKKADKTETPKKASPKKAGPKKEKAQK